MSLWKRLKILWELSESENIKERIDEEVLKNIPPLNRETYRSDNMAQIIKLRPRDEIEEILKENE